MSITKKRGIACNPGAIPPDLTATQVGFGDGANKLTSSAKFTYDVVNFAFAMGDSVVATGTNSVAFGIQTTASGENSFALGCGGTASAENAIVGGFNTVASAENAFAMGSSNAAKGFNSVAFGLSTIATYGQLALGRNNIEEGELFAWTDTDPAIVIGNGLNSGARSNAFKILKNGDISTIGTIEARLKIVQVTTLTKSLILSDANTEQEMSNAAAQTLTIEPDVTTNFPVGTRISVINYGVGVVTIAEGAGVTIIRPNSLVMNGQGSEIELVKRATDTWSLVGGAV